MSANLVIVESPAKAKTIQKFLGKSYKVIASNGHVRDLPKSTLGIDVENDFEPKYITIRGKGDILAQLRKEVKKADKNTQKDVAKKALCEKYYDIRTFGAVIATKEKQGQVRGAVQLTFARSVDPVVSINHSITRMAVTKESAKDKERTMGRKSTVPYGLYVAHGFINANLANQTGFDTEDLELLWEALANMFDNDRSAARGLMSARRIIAFVHSSKLGNAPAGTLFDRIKVTKKADVDIPRSFNDYEVVVDKENLPEGIEIKELL